MTHNYLNNMEYIQSCTKDQLAKVLCDLSDANCGLCAATDYCFFTRNGFLDWLDEKTEYPNTDNLIRKGKWKIIKDPSWSGGAACKCSRCGYGYSYGEYFEPERFKYCPNCGSYNEGKSEMDDITHLLNIKEK